MTKKKAKPTPLQLVLMGQGLYRRTKPLAAPSLAAKLFGAPGARDRARGRKAEA